jgi:hypothetical protein
MSPTQINKEVDVESLRTSWESEKQSLLSAIQSLKDLLAQTHKLRGLEKVDYKDLLSQTHKLKGLEKVDYKDLLSQTHKLRGLEKVDYKELYLKKCKY